MVVGYEFGKQSYDLLRKLGVNAEFNTFRGMGHSACPAELQDFKDFLAERLKPLN
jgi:predicted esterase